MRCFSFYTSIYIYLYRVSLSRSYYSCCVYFNTDILLQLGSNTIIKRQGNLLCFCSSDCFLYAQPNSMYK